MNVEKQEKNGKHTMTLNLSDAEMNVLRAMSKTKELSKTQVMRQALRLYQMIDVRLSRGERVIFENEMGKKADLLLL